METVKASGYFEPEPVEIKPGDVVTIEGIKGEGVVLEESAQFGEVRIYSEMIDDEVVVAMGFTVLEGNHIEVGTFSEYPEDDLDEFYNLCDRFFEGMADAGNINSEEHNFLEAKNERNRLDNGERIEEEIYLEPRKDGE